MNEVIFCEECVLRELGLMTSVFFTDLASVISFSVCLHQACLQYILWSNYLYLFVLYLYKGFTRIPLWILILKYNYKKQILKFESVFIHEYKKRSKY